MYTARIYNIETNEVAVIISGENQDEIQAKYEELVSPLTRRNFPEITKNWDLNEDEWALTYSDFGLTDFLETIEIEL